MAAKDTHRELIKALATGDAARATELNESMPAEERPAFNQYLSAVFSVLLEQQFPEGLVPETVADFAAELARNYEGTGVTVRPESIEGVIRAAGGDPSTLDRVPGEDILSSQLLVIGKIVMQDLSIKVGIDRYLDEADLLVVEWNSEGPQS